MLSTFKQIIQDQGFIILDGALATELEARGADLNHPLWSAKILTEDPAMIKQVNLDYLNAGANVIATASYQASFMGYERQGYSRGNAIKLMQLSVELAIEARETFLLSSENKINQSLFG
jgi:homocysteine S-methyltransferase